MTSKTTANPTKWEKYETCALSISIVFKKECEELAIWKFE